jgi:hypothetical protein
MTEINSDESNYYIVTDATSNNITVGGLNTLGYKDYTSGGVIEYNQPVNLTGFTGRMQIREKLDSEVVVHELTSANGGIVIDTVLNTITLNIPHTVTSTFAFNTAVYSIELISAGNEVTPFANGSISLVKEVTR